MQGSLLREPFMNGWTVLAFGFVTSWLLTDVAFVYFMYRWTKAITRDEPQ